MGSRSCPRKGHRLEEGMVGSLWLCSWPHVSQSPSCWEMAQVLPSLSRYHKDARPWRMGTKRTFTPAGAAEVHRPGPTFICLCHCYPQIWLCMARNQSICSKYLTSLKGPGIFPQVYNFPSNWIHVCPRKTWRKCSWHCSRFPKSNTGQEWL